MLVCVAYDESWILHLKERDPQKEDKASKHGCDNGFRFIATARAITDPVIMIKQGVWLPLMLLILGFRQELFRNIVIRLEKGGLSASRGTFLRLEKSLDNHHGVLFQTERR